MPYEERGNWFWDDIETYETCLSWEQCFECGRTDVYMWYEGHVAGRANVCPDCQSLMYTIFVFACAN